jgi:hypothetical protein
VKRITVFSATPAHSAPSIVRAAAPHVAQARRLLLRLARQTSDPQQARELADLAGILAHVIAAIERLATLRETRTR